MENSMCGKRDDALYIIEGKVVAVRTVAELLVGMAKMLHRFVKVYLRYAPHLTSCIWAAWVDGFQHKHTAENIGSSAITHYGVLLHSAGTLHTQPCAVDMEQSDYLAVKRFAQQCGRCIRHDGAGRYDQHDIVGLLFLLHKFCTMVL